MQRNIWKKSILIMASLFLVLSFVNIVRAGSDSDMAITSNVNEKLQNSTQLMGSQIFVETINGEVTLKGMVNSQADIIRAGKLAHYVDGVKHVDNRLSTFNSNHYGVMKPKPDCQIGANWAC